MLARYARSSLFAALLAILLLKAFTVWAIYRYYQACAQVKPMVQELLDSGGVKGPQIFAAPLELHPQQEYSPELLSNYLIRLGYVSQPGPNLNEGTFHCERSQCRVAACLKNEFRDLRLVFRGTRLQLIYDDDTNEQLTVAYLEPELLAEYYPPNDTTKQANLIARERLQYDQDLKGTNLLKALLFTEDRAYFEHSGVSYRGIARAVVSHIWRKVRELFGGGNSQEKSPGGASTITQQLVKNFFLSPEQSLSRKIDEAFLAIALEREMQRRDPVHYKERILEFYANEIYFGSWQSDHGIRRDIRGFAEAAQFYFGKRVQELSLSDAVTLAALVQSPARLVKETENLRQLRDSILQQLKENDPTTDPAEIDRAQQSPINLRMEADEDKLEFIALPGVAAAQSYLEAQGFSFNSPEARFDRFYLPVESSLLRKIHPILARQLIAFGQRVSPLSQQPDRVILQGSIITLDARTGALLTLNSLQLERGELRTSFDFRENDVEIASTIKPFIVLWGLNKKVITPDTTFRPADCRAPNGWQPENASQEEQTVARLLAKSNNQLPLCILNQARRADSGYREFLDWWQQISGATYKLGNYFFTNGFGQTAAINPLKLTELYSVFGGTGFIQPVLPVVRAFHENREFKFATTQTGRVVSARAAQQVTQMLQAVVRDDVDNSDVGTAHFLRESAGLSRNV
ncbi:MAG TPA: transglycosylase domain-containing protein [Pyrinomonadaceae bacterium]|nr:transglycosylase domain-containing protein [Pyrinomonadaceae bacterium]